MEPAAGHARAKGTAGGSRKQECPDRVVHRSHFFALTPATINPPSFPVKADERGAIIAHPDAIPDKPATIVLEVK